MVTPGNETKTKPSWRRYVDGQQEWESWTDKIFAQDSSHKCPTYVHKTPPCQGSCPSGEDIRGWLAIVRQQEKPPAGVSWEEYAFQRASDANPFPALMGRVCPPPVRWAVIVTSWRTSSGSTRWSSSWAIPPSPTATPLPRPRP